MIVSYWLLHGPLAADFPAGPFPLLLFALFSYVIGDKTKLQYVGVKEMKDVEALPPPSETKDQIPAQNQRGAVSYFICTRPGKGPVLLSDDNQALLNTETDLPKYVA